MITTINNDNVAYGLVVSDKTTGSLFRDITTGLNTPREISVRHQDYVDSKTKKVGRRTVVRKDVHIEMADGTIAPVSAMVIMMIPKDVEVTSAIVADALSITANMHGGHTPEFTELGTPIFQSGDQ